MELNHRNGYTFKHTMLFLRESNLLQHHAPYLVDHSHQLASPVDTTLFRLNGKLSPMFLH